MNDEHGENKSNWNNNFASKIEDRNLYYFSIEGIAETTLNLRKKMVL